MRETAMRLGKVSAAIAAVLLACVVACATATVGAGMASADEGGRAPGTLRAESASWYLSTDNVSMTNYDAPVTVYVYGYSGSRYYLDTNTSDSNVASVTSVYGSSSSGFYFEIEKVGVGTASVTVEDYYGNKQTVSVSCDPLPFDIYYGDYTFGASKSTRSTNYLYISPSYVSDLAPDSVIQSTRSSKSSVVSAKLVNSGTYSYVMVTPKKAGKATVSFTDQYGRTLTRTITVTKGYFKANLKATLYSYAYYGSSKVTVYTKAGAKVTTKMLGTTKKKKANKYGTATFKFNSKYAKLKTKYRVTVKTKRAKASSSFKTASNTWASVGTMYSNRYSVPVTLYHAHKGDTLTLKAGSEKHKYKVKSNADTQYTTIFFNRQMGDFYDMHIKMKNKYGQKLYSYDRSIRWR